MDDPVPLHVTKIPILTIFINRSHILIHSIAIALLIYYRLSFSHKNVFPWFLLFSGELFLSFIWLLRQSCNWRPVSRTAFPERLPEDDKLPPIDVFVCTADPNKEPTVEVMNTVISAMALDYPPEKLHVYLQDDGGSAVTLCCMREVFRFGKLWLPFCRRYEIATRSPAAYFAANEGYNGCSSTPEFVVDLKRIKGEYEIFKELIEKARKNGVQNIGHRGDHPTIIEVMNRNSNNAEKNQVKMPLLVYVSREKRPSHAHNFKAGALNILIRVSGLISNSPYILVLDCDMCCNDPSSVRQAMCFHLDPKLSHNLAFVQFPQRFRNISQHDIYDSRLRAVFANYYYGLDGLMGPSLCGTGFYIKRESLFGKPTKPKDFDLVELKESLGRSNEFIISVTQIGKENIKNDEAYSMLKETELVASCAYEIHTKWGEDVGFLYKSVVEDYFTSFKSLHCKGWKSVYYNPPKPQFLGNGATNLNDMLLQGTRWSSGLAEVAISKFFPLIYGPLHNMSMMGIMCYTDFAISSFVCLPLWIFATIPQLCLLLGIPLYPQASNSFIIVFMFILVSSLMKHLYEVLLTGFTAEEWINEQRIWMIRAITYQSYGTVDAIKKKLGLKEASFLATDKNDDDERAKLYQMGKFDFRTSTLLLAPLVTPVILNIIALIGGVARTIIRDDWDNMFGQIFLCFYITILSYPVIEGMVLRKDKGSIPAYVTLLSTVFAVIFLSLGSIIIFMY